MRLASRAAAALAVVALASPCWAGQVRLEIRGGLVTLSAKDASVREILAEWSRVGQTRIVNGERVPGGLVTLELNGVPEQRALDIVLRSVAGYVAAPRAAQGTTASQYDRIMIMAIARPAAAGPSPAPVNPAPQPYDQRGRLGVGGYQPQPNLMVDDQDEPVQPQPQPQPVAPAGGVSSAPQPGMATPLPQGGAMPGAYPQGSATPGTISPAPAAPRPGMTTSPGPTVPQPPKPPGAPGGPGGE